MTDISNSPTAGYPIQAKKKKWVNWKKLGNLVALFCFLLYGLVCLVPYLPAGKFWPIALLGYVFPFLLLVIFFIILVLAIRRSRWVIVPVLVLLLGWQQIRAVFAFHFFTKSFASSKPAGTLRVMLWNVSAWDQVPVSGKDTLSYRNQMMEVVDQLQADVLCLQEFFEPNNSRHFSSNIAVLKEKGYLYHHFYPKSVTYSGRRLVGMIILSKFPIVDSSTVKFENTPHSEGLISADIRVNDQVIRVFSTHLESSRTGGRGAASAVGKAKNVVSRLKLAYSYRTTQALLVRKTIDQSPHPVVVCGNLGDLPNSYAYFKVGENLQDAFLKKGAGFGRTFRFLSPTVRVDYIFADKKFAVDQFNIPDVIYSDHYPLIADLHLGEP
ncbi:MAG: endonuclease/exonuclease/phosphatase family protein [Chitinophagaceae bacterium]